MAKWTPETPWVKSNKETEAVWPTYVCRNPSCPSRGKSHPNCKCGAPSFAQQSRSLEYDADGGVVGGTSYDHFCSENRAHQKGCEYYAEGGEVPQGLPIHHQEDVHQILGLAAVHHGLHGLLKDVGKANLSDPEKHHKTLEKIQGGFVPETGHPLVGPVGKKDLEPIMNKMGPSTFDKEPHSQAFRGGVDYLHSSIQGERALDAAMGGFLGPNKKMDQIQENQHSIDGLKKHLDDLDEHPEKMLEVGGDLGHYLPGHSTAVAYQSAIATSYLKSLKPQKQQLAPLDTIEPVDKQAEAAYDRQIAIAQDPLLVLQHVKDGTLIPKDIQTLQTIYPSLFATIQKKAMAELIDAQTNGIEIPYKKKQTLSQLMDQPLDFTQSVMAMQAIIKSQLGANTPLQASSAQKKSAKGGVTGPELKAIEKADEMTETPLESRAINRRSH